MRIEKIHIDAFGKLKNYELSLFDGFNLIFGNNEDGKTTVMSFIRLMFYGNCTTKGDLDVNLRKRYTPFSGDKMGGSLCFSHDGKTYTLSREFGKGAKSDRVSLIDNISGEEVPIPAGMEVGEMFMGISAAAFERSIFLGSLPFDSDGAKELSSRLAASSSADGSQLFESAQSAVKSAMEKLKTSRKVGTLDKAQKELEALEHELKISKELEAQRTENEVLLKEIDAKEKALAESREKIKSDIVKSREAQSIELYKAEIKNREALKSISISLGDFDETAEKECVNALEAMNYFRGVMCEKSANAVKLIDERLKMNFEPNAELYAEQTAQAKETERLESIKSQTKIPKKTLAPAVLFLILALGFAAAFSVSPLCLVGTAACLAISVALFINNGKRKKILDFLAKTDEKINNAEEKYAQASNALADEKDAFDKKKNRLCETYQGLFAECEKLKKEIMDKYAFLMDTLACDGGICEEALSDKRKLLADKKMLMALLSQSEFKTLSDGELTQKCDSVSCENSKPAVALEAELEDIAKEEKLLVAKREQLIAKINSLFANTREAAVLEREISEKKAQIASMESFFEAAKTAHEILCKSHEEMRTTFAPELNKTAGELLLKLSGGKHGNTVIADDFSVKVSSENEILPTDSDYLSQGTKAQVDLCLRLAVSRLTFDGKLPIILDDAFYGYDDERKKSAMQFLSDYSSDAQVIFFTCHGAVKSIAEEAGANLIKL